MPGPSKRSVARAILDFFEKGPQEPFTAAEIAASVGHESRTVQTELDILVDRGLLRTKTVGDGDRVWWPAAERETGGGADSSGIDEVADRENAQGRRRLMKQYGQLAEFATRVDITDDLDEILRLVTEEARELIGTHQAVTSRTVNQNWEQAINVVSLSEKYADYRDYEEPPDGSGIYAVVCERNEPMRLTQAELEAHPAWEAFSDEAEDHPPMEGWLAVPIVGPDGENMGLIQLSDKYHGEFTEADEAILAQLANVAAAAIENSRLYDELRDSEERHRALFESMTEGYCVARAVDAEPAAASNADATEEDDATATEEDDATATEEDDADDGEPADYRYHRANDAFAAHTGLTAVAGRTVREAAPGDSQEWIDVFDRVVETGDAVSFERQFDDGSSVLRCQAFPVGEDSDGEVGVLVRDVTDRVERERRLEERERQLSRLMENVPGMVYRCRNVQGWPMEFVSDACREVTGYAPGTLVDGDVEFGPDIIVEEDREAVWAEIQAGVTDREPFSVSYRIETADGERRWVRDYCRGIFDDDDELVAIEGIISDVTEHRRTRQQLREERDMFAEGPAIVFRWKPDPEAGWPVEYVSRNVENVLGYAPAELESGEVAYADLIVEEELERVAAEVEQNTERGTRRFSHEPYRIRTKDGDVRWVKDTTQIVRDDDGEVESYLGYLVDITKRKEREQALQESRNQLRALIDGLPIAVFVAEEDGEIVEWNDAGEEIWGGEIAESQSIAEYDQYEAWWADTGVPVEPEEWPLARALQGEEVTDPDEIRIRGFDGEYRTVLNHGMPVRNADGEVTRAVVTLVDITERKEYERKLEASNERLEQFAYAASHDLQEPLRMVSSYLRLIEDGYEDVLDEQGREYLTFAVDGADRMREMIDGLLAYSRVETQGAPFEPVDLEQVLVDVRDDLQVRIAESDADVTTAALPTVTGDRDQLRQVFQNLLENAIEYSDEGPQVRVDAERDGDEWVVAVHDDGFGIEADNQERIFEVFQRLHTHETHPGTGIGLALCQRIVERHGGDIWVDSEPGEGSTFRLTLPAADGE